MKNKFSSGGIIEAFTRRVYEAVESYIANPFKYAADAQLQISPDDLTVTLAESDSVMPDCICVEIGDVGGLAEAIEELRKSGEWEEMGKNSFAYYKSHYSKDILMNEMERFIERAIGK